MTPCEKLGYKAGDKFISKGSHAFGDYSVIELEHDDGSEGPLFKLISGSCKYNNAKGKKAGAYCDLYYVQKIEEKEMTQKKEPHAHAEMIKAKADNMELVTLIKKHGGWRVGNVQDEVIFDSTFEYFLCLQKHKEACLHWLNGREAQTDRGCGDFCDVYPFSDFNGEWLPNFWYMLDDYESRIKPKKEKRWIAVHNVDSSVVLNVNFKSINEAKDATHDGNWQFIEIEVEV